MAGLFQPRTDTTMKLFLQSLMIFFGTLLAAGLVALGEPGRADLALGQAGKPATTSQHDASSATVLARWLPTR